MSTALRLISKVLEGPEYFMEAKRAGVAEKVFFSSEEKIVWSLIEVYFQRHANVPPAEDIKKLIPGFVFMPTEGMNISELATRMFNERIEIKMRQIQGDIEGLLTTGKYREAVAAMSSGASEISRHFMLSQDVKMSCVGDEILADYLRTKEGGYRHGLQWPWEPLNEEMGGIEAGTFNVLYGRPKSTKTFRLLEVAKAVSDSGYRSLIVSNEMSERVMLSRIAAIACELDYQKVKKGILDPEAERRYIEYLEQLREMEYQKEIVVTRLAGNIDGRTVSSIRAKMDEHEPDVLLIDSVYKMVDETTGKRDADPKVLRQINYDLQSLCQSSRIPTFVTTQANKMGEKAKAGTGVDVAFSDSFLMDCDLLLRIAYDKKSQRTIFLVQAAREIVMDGFSTGARCCDQMGPVPLPGGGVDWSLPSHVLHGDEPATQSAGERFQNG